MNPLWAQLALGPQRHAGPGALPGGGLAPQASPQVSLPVQTKLAVGALNDPLERQADQLADQALARSAPPQQQQQQQRSPARPRPGTAAKAATDAADPAFAGPGRPLESSLRRDMEHRFGVDFSQVQIHSGPAVDEAAQGLQARAYVAGSRIAFGAGEFAPGTHAGRRLLAHELAHVVQQRSHARPSLQRSPIEPAGRSSAAEQDMSATARFWSAMAAFQVMEQARRAPEIARRATELAVARLLREQGPRIRDLQAQIAEIQARIDESARHHSFVGGRTQAIRALEWEIKEIVKSYDPSIERSSKLPTVPMFLPGLPYSTSQAPLHGPQTPAFVTESAYNKNQSVAANIAPTQGVRFGKYGGLDTVHPTLASDAIRTSVNDAYAYDIETDMIQVANDLDRLARTGVTEIHIATGVHGDAVGGTYAEMSFLKQDARSIYETTQRHPGLKIFAYNMADPIQAARFDAMQALAAQGQLPGGATLAAHCFSCSRVPDADAAPAGPYGTVEVLDGRSQRAGAYLHGGTSVAFGALGIYGGLHDPDKFIGGLKVASGSAQVAGGASYMAGQALDSVGLVRWGSRIGQAGGYAGGALGLFDFYRSLQQKFEPGAQPLSGEEAVFGGVSDAMKLAGLWFPEAAFLALGIEFGVKPLAEAGSEYLTPMFVGAMARGYGVPESWLWGMH